MSCFLFHTWGKWQPYVERSLETPMGILFPKEVRGRTFQVTKRRQQRSCEKCGKVQDKEIGSD